MVDSMATVFAAHAYSIRPQSRMANRTSGFAGRQLSRQRWSVTVQGTRLNHVSPQKRTMRKPASQGQPVRVDGAAQSTDHELPAFIAAPRDAPAYYGFSVLAQSEIEGFVFGAITEPNQSEPASWGDAFVIAPNGSRAGIVWQAGSGASRVVCEPGPGRWGVYSFHFERPVACERDLIANLHSVLPELKAYYAAASVACPESTNAVPSQTER